MTSDIYVTDKPCKRCGSNEIYYSDVSIHIGKYCAKCKGWIKWVNKNDVPSDFVEALNSRTKNVQDDFDEPTKMERQYENNHNGEEDDDLPWF